MIHESLKYIFIVALIGLVSCTKEIIIELPSHDPELVVSAYLNDSDDEWTLILSHTTEVISSDNLELIDDATVELFEDGVLISDFSYKGNAIQQDTFWNSFDSTFTIFNYPPGNGALYQSSAQSFSPGKTYELKISAPDYADISSLQEVPANFELDTVILKPEGAADIDGYPMSIVEATVNKQAGAAFFLFSVQLYNSEFDYTNNVYTRSNNPLFTNGWKGPMIEMDEAPGLSTFEILVDTYIEQVAENGEEATMTVSSINSDLFNYYKSIESYYIAFGNPFAEPVILFSNITGGQGIFSIQHDREMQIVIE